MARQARCYRGNTGAHRVLEDVLLTTPAVMCVVAAADLRKFARNFTDFLRFKFWFFKVKFDAEFDKNIYNFVRFLLFRKNCLFR